MIHAEAESHALPGCLTTHFPAVFVEIATLPPAPGMMDSTKLPSDRCKPVGGQSRNWFEFCFRSGQWRSTPPTAAICWSAVVALKFWSSVRSGLQAIAGSDPEATPSLRRHSSLLPGSELPLENSLRRVRSLQHFNNCAGVMAQSGS